MDIKKDHINFEVGPVQISEEISRIGADPVPYFRTPDFSALMKENEALLKEFMDAPEDARAVFLTGSGTASMDAVTQNVFTKDDRLLVVAGGSFGHRFCEICEVYGIPHTAIELRQGHALTPADLTPYAGQGYTGLLVNMHETSTGVLYDMDMISAFCRENGLVLVVDAISAFLADDVSMKRWGADVVFTGSQKALAVPPGISMMVLSSRAVERIYANRPACYYLDLKAALKNGERGQTAAALAHPPPLLLGAGGVAEVGGGASHIVDIALELRVLRQQLRLPHHGLDGAGGDHAPLMKGQCAEVAAAEAAPVVGDGEAHLLDGGNLLPIHGMDLPDIGQVVQGIQCLPAQWTGRWIHHQHPALTRLQHGAPPDGIVLVVLDLGGSGVGRLVGTHLLIGGTGHRMKAAALSGGCNVGGAGDVGDLTGRHLSG